jgi:ferredoxin
MTASRRVRVDPRLCEAHALCIDPAPDVFDLGDYDLATCNELAAESRWDDVEAASPRFPAKPSDRTGLPSCTSNSRPHLDTPNPHT